jgi:hypothetical protein
LGNGNPPPWRGGCRFINHYEDLLGVSGGYQDRYVGVEL